MRHRIWLGLLLALLAGPVWAAGGTSVVVIPGVANGVCNTWPNCPALPNDVTHPFYFAPSTGSTWPVSGTVTITPSGTQTVTGTVGISAGSAIIGKAGIDQTTPGTTNGVVVNGSASVDGSTTQMTGGIAQALFSAATPAHGWKVAIPVAIASISTFACYVSDGTTTPSATTPGSLMVYAGGQQSTEPGQKPFGPVYVNCPTTGQVISAQMW